MRQFVIHGHEVPTTGPVSLDDLPGAGRLDLLCRCVTSALLVSHGIRDDTRIHLVVDDEYTLRFDGGTIRGLHPDERSTAARIVDALGQREEAIGHVPVEISPGITLTRMGFEETVAELADDGPIFQLHEGGAPLVNVEMPDGATFVLSDHVAFTDADDRVLQGLKATRVSVGPVALHADQVISIVHNWMDTAGFASYP